jgi:hypothetical protein
MSISILTVQLHGYYVAATDGKRAIKYRLIGELPFGMLLNLNSMKYALPRIRDKTPRKIAKYGKYAIFDFGDSRVAIRNYEPKYEHKTNETLVIEKGRSFKNEILRDYQKRYRIETCTVLESYYMVSEINENISQPCVPLFRLPTNFKKAIKPGFLNADFFSITFNKNRLTIEADVVGLKGQWDVVKYGSDAKSITLFVDTRNFFESINDGCLIGYRSLNRGKNTYLIYIHNKRTDYIQLCSKKEK